MSSMARAPSGGTVSIRNRTRNRTVDRAKPGHQTEGSAPRQPGMAIRITDGVGEVPAAPERTRSERSPPGVSGHRATDPGDPGMRRPPEDGGQSRSPPRRSKTGTATRYRWRSRTAIDPSPDKGGIGRGATPSGQRSRWRLGEGRGPLRPIVQPSPPAADGRQVEKDRQQAVRA